MNLTEWFSCWKKKQLSKGFFSEIEKMKTVIHVYQFNFRRK
jgi:hypothetical protein